MSNENYLMPPQRDIDKCLIIEKDVLPSEMALYMNCMDNRPLSVRKEARDLRDGCILSWVFVDCAGKRDKYRA
jgi:hypothetical protein